MAIFNVAANGDATVVVATTAKAVIQVNRGTVKVGISASPDDGILLHAGERFEVDGWTAVWSAVTAVPGSAAVLNVETE